MKLTKNSKTLFFGLTLLLSLVSFTGVINHLPIEAIKTTLIVSDYNEDLRFSIKYQNVNNSTFVSLLWNLNFSFTEFQNDYVLKETNAYKINKSKTLSLKSEQLRTKLYSFFAHNTLYNRVA